MRIVAVSQTYLPDPTGAFLADLLGNWAVRGHQVTVLTAMAHPTMAHEIEVVKTGHGSYRRKSLATRAFSQLSFGASVIQALRSRSFDVLLYVGSSWVEPFTGHSGKHRTIHWVHDVYPDAVQAVMSNTWSRAVERPARFAVARAYRRADRAVALSDAMALRLAHLARRSILDVIPLWALREWKPVSARALAWRQKRGIAPEEFVVLYHGNLGLAYDFEPLLAAARRLRTDRRVTFALVGDGGQRRTLERHIASEGLTNTRIVDGVAPEALTDSLSMGDVHVMPLRPNWNGITFPSKFVAALAVGRPVIVTGAVDGEVAQMVRNSGCGLVARTGDDLAETIKMLASEPAVRAEMCARARRLCDERFGRDAALHRWDALLAEVGR